MTPHLLAAASVVALLPAAAFAQQAPPPATAAAVEEEKEGAIIVTATRLDKPLSAIPAMVTVVDREAIEEQRLIATDTSSLLGQLVPGFAPSRQKLTSFGESFRGRSPLYLIDGVPQSNPLRNGSRESYTIDLAVVERIEVINGANAIQGLGATGGIVNFVTRKPDDSGEWGFGVDGAITAADDFDGDGFEYRASSWATKRSGAFDFIAAASFQKRSLFFDGEGRSIGIDTTQGDLADSTQRNLFAKVGWEPDANQRLQVTVNDFLLEGDGDFQSLTGERDLDIPVTAIPGAPPGEPAVNDVNTISIDYNHRVLFGGAFSAQLYRQDFAATYGGGTFGVFQDPLIAPRGTLFDQSENRSTKYGARATLHYRDVGGTEADVIGGVDWLRDTTSQILIQTGREWVPETTYENVAPFVQVDLPLTAGLTLAGGVRWENATLKVDDYEAIAGNRADFVRTPVTGGSPSFDELLVNGSLIYEFLPQVSVYASYSQGYTVPDVGRVLRGVSVPNTRVDDLVTLEPVIADNYEIGFTARRSFLTAQLAAYISQSDQGSVLVPDADGIFSVVRQKTRVKGFEAAIEARLPMDLRAGGNLSILSGRVDSDRDGSLDADLDAANIGPDRLNLYVGWQGGPWNARLQSATLFDRDFENKAGATTASFQGYTTLDLYAGYDTGFGKVALAVQNLLDEQFITYFGQAAPPLRDDRYFSGRGRTFTLGFSARF